MGCFVSKARSVEVSQNQQSTQPEKPENENGHHKEVEAVPAFREFSYAQLRLATNGFSPDNIVSEHGEKAPNAVYRGRLANEYWVAVKCF
eukprot:c4720_g1_i1 orf=923-1192(+)